MKKLSGFAFALALAAFGPGCSSDVGTSGQLISCYETAQGQMCTEGGADTVDLDGDGVEDTYICSDIEDADGDEDSDGIDDDLDDDLDNDGIDDDLDDDDDNDGIEDDLDDDDDNDGIEDDDDCDELDDDEDDDDDDEDDEDL